MIIFSLGERTGADSQASDQEDQADAPRASTPVSDIADDSDTDPDFRTRSS